MFLLKLSFLFVPKMKDLIKKHYEEIKKRFFYFCIGFLFIFFISYTYCKDLLYLLSKPLLEGESLTRDRSFFFTSAYEAFKSHLFISIFITFIFSIPLLLSEIWLFIRSGLYGYEKKKVFFLFFLFSLSIFLGTSLGYFFILPLCWNFLLSFESREDTDIFNIYLENQLGTFLENSIYLFFSSIFIIQYPILLFYFIQFRIINERHMILYRKASFILFILIGTLFSPPDLVSQWILALPLLFFYELAIFLSILKRAFVYT